MLGDDIGTSRQPALIVRQSDNLHNGGTFSVGEVPTGVARPNLHNSIEQFTDGYGEGEVGTKGSFGGEDFFSGLGQERKKKEPPPSSRTRIGSDLPKMSAREINTGIYDAEGVRLPSSVEAMSHTSPSNPNPNSSRIGVRHPVPGSSGSSWRMMKLKRAYEAAEDEGKSIEELGTERFGSIEAWEAAKAERRILDERSVVSSRGQARNHQQQRGQNMAGRSGTSTPDVGRDEDVDEFGREKRGDQVPSSAPFPVTAGGTAGRYVFTDPSLASDPNSVHRQDPGLFDGLEATLATWVGLQIIPLDRTLLSPVSISRVIVQARSHLHLFHLSSLLL